MIFLYRERGRRSIRLQCDVAELYFWQQSDSRGCSNGSILSPKQGLRDSGNLEKRSQQGSLLFRYINLAIMKQPDTCAHDVVGRSVCSHSIALPCHGILIMLTDCMWMKI